MRITQFVPATRMLIIVMAHMTVRHTQIGVAVLLEQVFATQVSILVNGSSLYKITISVEQN